MNTCLSLESLHDQVHGIFGMNGGHMVFVSNEILMSTFESY